MRFPYRGAGIGLVYKDTLLVGKRSDHPFCGRWAVPGGGREASDKDYLETAIRELGEETGIVFSSLNAERLCSWTLRLPFFHWTTYYYRIESNDMTLCPNEFSSLQWVPIAELKKKHLRPFMASEVRHLERYL